MSQPTADEPILHEFFVPRSGEPMRRPRDGPPSDGEAGTRPVYQGDTAQLPGDETPDRPGARNAPPLGMTDVELDRDTDQEGWLTYWAVFDPTVAPFKRVGARDQVVEERGQIRLTTDSTTLFTLPVTELSRTADREWFWGSVLVSLEPDSFVAIPSVAPQMQILEYETAPAIELSFFHDRADITHVRGDHTGLVRLNYLVSAPRQYFGGPLPVEGTLEDIPQELRPRVPDSVLLTAAEAFEMLGLTEASTPVEMVWGLAGYLRAFRAEPFPESSMTQNIFRDILFGGFGVCRHRAFVFVVTLQAWGIPARYVYNEAHAFAEVYLPNLGWRRIDLGGGAEGLNVVDAEDRVLHAPEDDELPVPEPYVENYTRSVEEIPQPSDPTDNPESSDVRVNDTEGTDGQWDPSTMDGPTLRDLPIPTPPSPDEPTQSDNDAPTVDLLTASQEGFRGEDIVVAGRIHHDDVGLPNQQVLVFLGPIDGDPDGQVIEVGSIISDDNGWIEGTITLPTTLPLGQWGVYLVYYE